MTPQILEFNLIISLLYSVSIYVVMWFISKYLLILEPLNKNLTPSGNRYGSIDGLRGILAIGVFIHHSFTAYGYFTTGVWQYSSNPLLNQFGQSSVALFFMITGFLFTNKALGKNIEWKKFFTSRARRLFPLYFIVVNIVFLIAFGKTSWSLNESILNISTEYLRWITFVVFGRPDINGLKDSALIIAGVNWSLKFEVLFYILVVPTIYFASRYLSDVFLLIGGTITSIIAFISIKYLKLDVNLSIFHFQCGILIALLFRMSRVREIFRNKYFHYVSFISVIVLVFTHSWTLSLILLAVIFSSVIGGGSLRGLLNTRPAIWLGDISYGVYLVHGLLLYCVLSILNKTLDLNELDLFFYWFVVFCTGSLTVILASLSYAYLEKPIMSLGKNRRKDLPNELGVDPNSTGTVYGGKPVSSVKR